MQNLWGACVDWAPENISQYITDSPVCGEPLLTLMEAVKQFFQENHNNYVALYEKGSCPDIKDPSELVPFNYWQALVHIYGWVPFNEGCGASANPLAKTATEEWNHAQIQSVYIHDLQYNHKTAAKNDPNLLFNPYVQLIHDRLKMNAYAFSVDDAVGFMSELGEGLHFAVGGSKGLENPQQFSYADGFSVAIGVSAESAKKPTEPLIKEYGVCLIIDDKDCDDFKLVLMPTNSQIAGFRVGTVASYPIQVRFTDVDNNVYTFRVKRKFTACLPTDTPETCNDNNKDVIDKAQCSVVGGNGEVHAKSAQWCETANPNQAKDEKDQHLTKNFISFGVPVGELP